MIEVKILLFGITFGVFCGEYMDWASEKIGKGLIH